MLILMGTWTFSLKMAQVPTSHLSVLKHHVGRLNLTERSALEQSPPAFLEAAQLFCSLNRHPNLHL